MSLQANDGFRALTEKEKQTLRLIARGHDAKSTARSLGLSVHTINERLRDARRKMSVSSSREAARLLLDAESVNEPPRDPDLLRDIEIGDDTRRIGVDQNEAPFSGVRRASRRPLIISGVLVMILTLGLSALLFSAQVASPTSATADPPAANSPVADAARHFLTLVDQGRWEESYQATTTSFRKLNTAAAWASASEKARPHLGAVVSRTLVSQENLPAPPDGYEVVKFRTSFANKASAMETVSLRREDGSWRVAGVMID